MNWDNIMTAASNFGKQKSSTPGFSSLYNSQGGFSGIANYAQTLLNQGKAAQQQSADNAELLRLQAQTAAMPRLPTFDSSAAWASSNNSASAAWNPVYNDNLTRYLKKKNLKINQAKGETAASKRDINTELTQSLEDTTTGRVRTGEDADIRIGDITANEDSFQRQEGRQFDAARAALLGDVADAGLTESGLGQGIVENATVDRNLASEDQVREFDNAKRDTEMFRTRTLADLDTSDVRSSVKAKARTADEDRRLKDFIDLEGMDEEIFRATNEADRLMKINQESQSAYQKVVADRLQQLIGGGARAQDIALFKQIYG